MPDLKLFTVAQLRDWIEHDHAAEGLSETIIAPHRAYAIVHNPYVKDDDPVVAAIFVDGENVAYTTAFPEMIDGKRYWWFSTLWCDSKYRGNGYGLVVIGSLVEVYGAEYCLDRWGAQDTVEIFSYFGHKATCTYRYALGSKIDKRVIKGKVLASVRAAQKCLHRLIERPAKREDYILRYIPYIDECTYAFIRAHKGNDYMLRTQKTLNWILRYPYTYSAPLANRIVKTLPIFHAETPHTELFAVQVWDGEELIGFYMMKQNADVLHILYLYYEEVQKAKVYASICDHVKRMKIEQCVTEHKPLAEYLKKEVYFPKRSVYEISFSVPEGMELPKEGTVQYGDGDCFTA